MLKGSPEMESISRSARKPSGPSAMLVGIPRRKGMGGGLGDLLDILLETIFAKTESERKRKHEGKRGPTACQIHHCLTRGLSLSLSPVLSTSTTPACVWGRIPHPEVTLTVSNDISSFTPNGWHSPIMESKLQANRLCGRWLIGWLPVSVCEVAFVICRPTVARSRPVA